ncbi:uncharacterized protein [Rutidosis leptorrhynchoides]|uniref:uncharacterized protein n=1 Tax=Rutidosis leptorrhynchoides TaxID=125765 RepID=UPI003A9933BC
MSDSASNHSSALGTWRNIILTSTLLEDLQVPFKSSFVKTIRDGGATYFWHEQWIADDKLCNLFPRLYRLETDTNVLVKDRVVAAGNNSTAAVWNWARAPTGRTTAELDHLNSLIASFGFDLSNMDSWKWTLSSNGMFTVKKLSSLIDVQLIGFPSPRHHTPRNILVPKKIEIFAWRLLKKRLPVRLELDKRGIDLHSVRCPLCDDDVESVDHSFVFCKYSRDIWERIYKWWNLGNFSSFDIPDILNDNLNIASSCFGKKLWQALKWVASYLIWKNRNNMVFKGKYWSTPVMVNEIQVNSFEWIASWSKCRNLDWLVWTSNPHVYLSM